MLRDPKLTLAVMSALSLSACNPAANLEEASNQIDRYQHHFSSEEVDDMYDMTSAEFRRAASREDFDEFAKVITERLGPIETSERIAFNLNTTPAGTATVVTMQTQFEKGEGTEVYTFIGSGAEMRVQGWTVNSDRLMLNAEDLEVIKRAEESKEGERD